MTDLVTPGTLEPTEPVTLSHVQTFLASHYDTEVTDLDALGHGEWSAAFAYRHQGGDYVIRFGHHADDFARDQFAAAFSAPTLPIPRIVEIGAAFGRHYAISERAFGTYLDSLDEEAMRRTLPALFASLDAARAIPLAHDRFGGIDGHGVAPFPTWRAFLLNFPDEPGRIGGWRTNLERSPVGSGPFDTALAYLESLIPAEPITPHLIHSDLLNFNVLVANDRPSAILDWGCATAGDFLYDPAWMDFWQPWYPAWAAIDFAAETASHYDTIGLKVPYFTERFRCCQIHIGLASQAYQAFVQRWDDLAWTAARTLKVAGISV